MAFGIMVFNPQPLGVVNPDSLRKTLLTVNFETLSSQYDLYPVAIEPAKANLDVVVSEEHEFPYFLVEYGDERGHPLVINEQGVESARGHRIFKDLLEGHLSGNIKAHLRASNFLVEIELAQHQLTNMGLLLAYEIARWAAFKGEGIVLGLDGRWYRLNQHRAYLPLD